MKHTATKKWALGHHLGCFGNYAPEDSVCHTHCALSIRCSIERDQNLRLEMLEELMESDTLSLKIQ